MPVDKELNKRLGELKVRVADLAQHPPGGDSYMGDFYSVVSEMMEEGGGIGVLVQDVLKYRNTIPAHHLANLLFRATQYFMLFHGDSDSYPTRLAGTREWRQELEKLVGAHGILLNEILKTKDTGTTLFQRYAGPQMVLSRIAGSREVPLKVTDWGCGRNHGLAGLILGEPFKEITDETNTDGLVPKMIAQRPQIEALGLDCNNISDPKLIEWQLACSFYPTELQAGEMERYLEFERRVKETALKMFVQSDIRKACETKINGKKWDAVILSTVLYQMTLAEGEQTVKNAMEIMNPDGVVIVQDFVRKGEKGTTDWLDFDASWFSEPFAYRTLVIPKQTGEILEVLRWNNGRCRKVRRGEDFDEFFDIVK